jgi:ribosomal protein S6--L-glutamate ligase
MQVDNGSAGSRRRQVAQMSSHQRTTSTGTRLSVIRPPERGELASPPARLCFVVEEKYEHDTMPGAVAAALTSWGHQVDVLRPHSSLTDLSELVPVGENAYDAYVLKTVTGGPGLSILEAAAAAGIPTVNNHRAIRLARDKAVAASRARSAGIPFPQTWFAARSALLSGLPREAYPLVVKPNNGSSCEQVLRVDSPEELDRLDIDDSGYLLVQPYLPNPGYDLKLYNTGDEIFAAVRRSPLHAGDDVVEELVPVSPELRALTVAVGRAFGLDIYGIDVIETPHGWMVLDINDFPSFGLVPGAAWHLARTVLRLTRAAQSTTTTQLRSARTADMEATA